MSSSPIIAEDVGGVKLITFNRPKARNAFNRAMREAFIAEMTAASENGEIKAVVLTGSGSSFSAGIDITELEEIRAGNNQQQKEQDNDAPLDSSWSFLEQIRDFSKFLFMAVNGAGVGLGTTILGFADIAIAGKSARFKCPFTELGVGAEVSSTWLLPQLLGWQNASWLLLSSEWVTAEQAKEMGLVYGVVSDKKLLEKTMKMASKIATRDLASIVGNKTTMTSLRREFVIDAYQREGKKFMELVEAKLKKTK